MPLQDSLRSFRKAIRPFLRPWRRRVLSPHEMWRRSIQHELTFWDRFLTAKGSEGYGYRTDPTSVLKHELIIRAIARIGTPDISILDVGAGALTNLGKTLPGHRLRIVAIDPLADEYDELLRRHGVTPIVRTIRCEGEKLLDCFESGTFDVAHANNSLDHAYDPILIIRNMIQLVRPGGSFSAIAGTRDGRSATVGSISGTSTLQTATS